MELAVPLGTPLGLKTDMEPEDLHRVSQSGMQGLGAPAALLDCPVQSGSSGENMYLPSATQKIQCCLGGQVTSDTLREPASPCAEGLCARPGWTQGGPCMCAQAWPTPCDPMDCSPQDPLSMEFSRQEYWSGLPFPLGCHLCKGRAYQVVSSN